jgi:LmbE family N-acetylglucosaminyl deacetylase
LIGAEAVFILYPDAEIPFNDESSMRVCDAIREHKPDTVVTHWNGSWHKDHRNCHLIVHDAIFYAGLDPLSRSHPAHTVSKVFYAENWEDATNFVPDTYVNIEAIYKKWLQACDFYPMWRVKRVSFATTITTAVSPLCAELFRDAAPQSR